MENIINKCAEQTGKSCIFSPLSEFYSFSSFQKDLIICFLCKHFFMNLRHYLSISLLRDEVQSYLVTDSQKGSSSEEGKKIMVTHKFVINFLTIIFIMKSMNKICAYLILDLKKNKEKSQQKVFNTFRLQCKKLKRTSAVFALKIVFVQIEQKIWVSFCVVWKKLEGEWKAEMRIVM